MCTPLWRGTMAAVYRFLASILFGTCFTLRVRFLIADDYNKTSPTSVVDITYDFVLRIETGRERSLLYNLLEVINTIFGLRVETGTERALMM